MGKKDVKSGANGKGGNFDTRQNPFLRVVQSVGGYPELSDTPSITRAIDLALKNGCAVMVGTTRDQGALVLTILDGDNRHRTYCSNDDELSAAVFAMEELYGN